MKRHELMPGLFAGFLDGNRDVLQVKELLRCNFPRYVLREQPEKRDEDSDGARLLLAFERIFNFFSQVNLNAFREHPDYQVINKLINDSERLVPHDSLYRPQFIAFQRLATDQYQLCLEIITPICARIDGMLLAGDCVQALNQCLQHEFVVEEQQFFQALEAFCKLKLPHDVDQQEDIPRPGR